MNTDRYYLNARELFLLCSIRKGKVEAINQTVHEWTLSHYTFVENQLSKSELRNLPQQKGFQVLKQNLVNQAKNNYKCMECIERHFVVHEHDLGFSLADHGKDLPWFDPRHPREDWCYRGQFKLIEPLSEKELYIIVNYAKSA